MAYLLDTNVVSELRKGNRCETAVREWFDALDEDDAYLSVLVVGEIERGIERIRKRDPKSATRLRRWLSNLSTHRRPPRGHSPSPRPHPRHPKRHPRRVPRHRVGEPIRPKQFAIFLVEDVTFPKTGYARFALGLQRLLAANDIEQLDAGRKVGPVVDLARPNIELRAMKRTPNAASLDDLATSERCEDVRAVRLRSVKAIF